MNRSQSKINLLVSNTSSVCRPVVIRDSANQVRVTGGRELKKFNIGSKKSSLLGCPWWWGWWLLCCMFLVCTIYIGYLLLYFVVHLPGRYRFINIAIAKTIRSLWSIVSSVLSVIKPPYYVVRKWLAAIHFYAISFFRHLGGKIPLSLFARAKSSLEKVQTRKKGVIRIERIGIEYLMLVSCQYT